MKLLLALGIAIILIPVISLLTTRMRSLPVQFVCASISIVVLSLEIFSQMTKNDMLGEFAIYNLIYCILFLIVFSAMALASYGFHFKDKTEYKKVVQDFAYVFSLFWSCCTLILSYVVVKKADIIFSPEFDKKDALYDLYKTTFSTDGDFFYLLILTLIIFVVTILFRVVNDKIFHLKNNTNE